MGEGDLHGAPVTAASTAATATAAACEVFWGRSPGEVLCAAGAVGAGSTLSGLTIFAIGMDDPLIIESEGVDQDIAATTTSITAGATISAVRIDRVQVPPRAAAATTTAATSPTCPSFRDGGRRSCRSIPTGRAIVGTERTSRRIVMLVRVGPETASTS
jgi:hypothetical protein